MSKHEEMRRKLQIIRDDLLELNRDWYSMPEGAIADDFDNEKEVYCPGDISHIVHDLMNRVKHDESTIEKLLKKNQVIA